MKLLLLRLILLLGLTSSLASFQTGPVNQEAAPRLAAIRLPRPIAGQSRSPAYPAEAAQRGIKGVVGVSLRVDGTGNVVAVRIERPLDPKLDELAINAVSTWKYQPAAFGGRTLSTTVQVAIPFFDGAVLGGIAGRMSQPPFNAPTGLAIDTDGNVYVADAGRSLIYKINPAGTNMSVFAGDASEGFKGDGGPASSAQLNVPYDLAIDGAGNLYVADTGNSRVRMIMPSGTIRTVAGNGIPGFSGDGGPATAAQLDKPLGIAVNAAGVLFIADTGNSRIRSVSPDGIIRTISGPDSPGSTAQLGLPYDVAVDASGNIYVADMTNEKVHKIASNGITTTMVSEPIVPLGVATDREGSLYVADARSLQIRKVVMGVVSSVRLDPEFAALPTRVVVDPRGTLYVADGSNGFVRKITTMGIITSLPASVR